MNANNQMKTHSPNKCCPFNPDDVLTTSIGTDGDNNDSWQTLVDDNGNLLTKGF